MAVHILLPALSPTMEEGTLAKWRIKKGDRVSLGDVIAEIETEKATMEVEAIDEGVVDEILVAEGSSGVKVNTPIARLAVATDASARADAATEAEAPSSPPAPTNPATPASDTAAAPNPAPLISPPRPSSTLAADDGPCPAASPLALRIAAQRGVDLASVKGSGLHGRIIKADVAAPGPKAMSPVAAPVAAPESSPSELIGFPAGSYDLVPLDGMRRTVARRMTSSFRDVPHFPLTIEIEVDALLAARGRINRLLEQEGVKVSVNDFVLRAAALTLKLVPESHASYSAEGIALHHHADIAMAVAVPGGLITPIIRAAETKGLADIARETKDLAERARAKKLKPEEYHGGTFSVSNLGMFGVKTFSSILNEPQGSILSVGASEKRPVVRKDAVEIATIMSVTLTCDHRAMDGVTGARWLQAFKTFLEEPLTMIA